MTETPADEIHRLRAALRDPAALVDEPAAARVHYLMRAHAVERLDRAARRAGVGVLLVKGAALALTVYPQPWQRPMADIDLLVAARDEPAWLGALVREGWSVLPVPADRRLSHRAFSERVALLQRGALTVGIEVHRTLDKLVPRPIDLPAIAARAMPAPGLAALRVPDPTDHVLLVILHLACSEFRHPPGWVDLALLFDRGVDLARLEACAHRWRMRTACYLAFSTMAALDHPVVPAALVERLRPGPARLRALGWRHQVGSYPVCVAPPALGIGWVLRQTPLRDDLGRWALGVGVYAATRAVERLLWRRSVRGRGRS